MAKRETRIIAVTTDLFIRSRISELAGSLGIRAEFAFDETEYRAALLSRKPRLVVLDLSSPDYDAFLFAKIVKETLPGTRTFGFFPHVKAALAKKAEASGFDHVVPNSALIRNLRSVLLEVIQGS